ncbi:PTS glucose transporter subunit IIA [Romboutsia sp. 1001216sp1]|uniref:PTS sugar transporter subunit IIA n=1 Tax=unclassified Romboutsia TaxID=2626894 RepID=UPI0018AC4C11|nr:MULTISPECIES: PTS glucose transporter subunit IIA [unclassified Romboutsia]MDB8792549.1 PTS glucose transporter subunit IIA [Romboutsia sp. 1001216sp1]MDB8796283.1 PTS glucose transporter subunit IIA [Romboutsia sp. 1001216sp1]MDB8798277.1 PTS glucose transporter subunit IIA [Romboutsia sp. 1001216sp1]MDB8803707.1 PTS glucose transporter subunit IIA [Romboutsia sp. 1001216sp1]MDB8806943.1 PTS glucose transporter subunit IIA [Romboutsia sp. 1001216sp1]
MFSIFKKKNLALKAPISGKVIDLCNVPDEVFSNKMLGDGVAIDTTGDVVVAPCDGTIELIMDTNHAFAMKSNDGLELLVHVGIDTVTLKGQGFKLLRKVGDKVTAGTPILELNRQIFIDNNISLITPVIITNNDALKELNPMIGSDVKHGDDNIIEYKL